MKTLKEVAAVDAASEMPFELELRRVDLRPDSRRIAVFVVPVLVSDADVDHVLVASEHLTHVDHKRRAHERLLRRIVIRVVLAFGTDEVHESLEFERY